MNNQDALGDEQLSSEVMLGDSGKWFVYIPCGIEIADCHDQKIAEWICEQWNRRANPIPISPLGRHEQEDITHTLWYRGSRMYSELKNSLVLHPEIWCAEGLQQMLDQWNEIATRYASKILLAPKATNPTPVSVGGEEAKK